MILASARRIVRSLAQSQINWYSSEAARRVKVNIDGECHDFPSLWLRDNCQCDKCYHHSSNSRIIEWGNFDVNVSPKNINNKSNSISIEWNDGHVSEFNLDWLHRRSFKPNVQEKCKDSIYRPKQKTWSKNEFKDILKTFQFKSVLTSDNNFHDWLENLAVYGIALIENVPESHDSLNRIIKKIGLYRETHYGRNVMIENQPGVSYSGHLQLHSDVPYYEYCPGVTFLHCISQTKAKGGVNTLVDGLHVANLMREKYPNEFKLLSEVNVEWSGISPENVYNFYKLLRAPVICLKDGEIARIIHSVPKRGSYFPTNIENVDPWYKAYKLFVDLLEEDITESKIQPGQIIAIDNIRLVHGRTAYNDTTNNVRKLIDGHIDWDEIYSRLRRLKSKLNMIQD